jgi:hypothetical protein
MLRSDQRRGLRQADSYGLSKPSRSLVDTQRSAQDRYISHYILSRRMTEWPSHLLDLDGLLNAVKTQAAPSSPEQFLTAGSQDFWDFCVYCKPALNVDLTNLESSDEFPRSSLLRPIQPAVGQNFKAESRYNKITRPAKIWTRKN